MFNEEEEGFTPIKAEIAKVYPRYMYHPDYEPLVVASAEEEEELGGWYDSPADYGVFTCPSAEQIAEAKRK
jgi:hypothetical protein